MPFKDPDQASYWSKLALRHHRDRSPRDPAEEEKFKKASEAYFVLSDPMKRAANDALRPRPLASVTRGRIDPGASDFNHILDHVFGFADLFGGRRRGTRTQTGRGCPVRPRNGVRAGRLRHAGGNPGAANGVPRGADPPGPMLRPPCRSAGACAGPHGRECAAPQNPPRRR